MSWTRNQYFHHRKKLESEGVTVILVDMTGHPIEDSVPVSDELFFGGQYPEGTYFVLYCDSGCTISGYTKDKLIPLFPQYHFIDISSGTGMYRIEKDNFLYEQSLSTE